MGASSGPADGRPEDGSKHWADRDGHWVHWRGLQQDIRTSRLLAAAQRSDQRHGGLGADDGGGVHAQAVAPASLLVTSGRFQHRQRARTDLVGLARRPIRESAEPLRPRQHVWRPRGRGLDEIIPVCSGEFDEHSPPLRRSHHRALRFK